MCEENRSVVLDRRKKADEKSYTGGMANGERARSVIRLEPLYPFVSGWWRLASPLGSRILIIGK